MNRNPSPQRPRCLSLLSLPIPQKLDERRALKTYGTPTWIWSVVVVDAVYVRPYNGKRSTWYQAAIREKAGRITAAGMTKEVAFEEVEGKINERIDEAYRAKYRGSPYLAPMVEEPVRSITVRIMPR